MEHYDLIVIGGGPSGYAGAMRAIDFGKKVLLIEKRRIGGAGVYDGVLTSKTLWEQALKTASIREMIPDYEVNFESLKKIVDEAVYERKTQMTLHLKLLDSLSKKLFTYEKGSAYILDKKTIRITKEDGKTKEVSADNILIATGSRPRIPNNIEVDEQHIVTSDGIKNFTSLPESMVVLGAGVIGCEFATIFSALGKTKVFLIDKADRILPFEDEDVAEVVTTNLELQGAKVHHGASLKRMEIKNGKVEYELEYKDGKTEVLTVSKALISVGRVPNVENIGLENAGVKLNERGSIWDDDTQTNISNIYVAGDVTTEVALVNVGEREARHAVVRMFGPTVKPLSYKNISTIMFLNPEVASVGMSEQECVAKNIPHKVVKLDYTVNARAIAMRKTTGFFKIIVTNDNGMRILGMRVVGEHASSAIQGVAYLIHTNQGIRDLADMMHPHPSITEGVQECLRMLLNKSIYKPYVFKDRLKCYVCENGVCTPIESLV
ncbi:dihydrolipoyl dehydrogenase family protein [Aurantibacillus circumpalustris]|uniref:dihydrolipoyl dehydrogenase family protein n=1 Tax=Aurantibacillus circumpalustris TaxID=3036359 RepID=UPI00295BEC55|nr:NAD(P)/FAD-dependent oxidoreductase [Aurantibacillus circumpalustris]